MKKTAKIFLTLVLIAVVAVAVVLIAKGKGGSANLDNITGNNDLEKVIDKVYKEADVSSIPSLTTVELDITDADQIKMFTGLESGKDLEYIVVSEPMMTSQAYSFVVAKVKPGVNASQIAKIMSENADMIKWICVQADKLYATSCGDIVCLIMSNSEVADSVLDGFKKVTGTTEHVYGVDANIIELPPDKY